MFDSTRRKLLKATGIGGTMAALSGCASAPEASDTGTSSAGAGSKSTPATTDVDRVAADPTDIPGPIDRDEPKHHDVELTVKEVTAEIEPGVTFDYMTFDGQIPGPMIRVRQGDTVSFTLKNAPDNKRPHNVDMHAIYGTGGGNVATTAAPGEQNAETFTAKYPGAFIYHCAVPNLDMHISAGMFGMILVEPKDGLPEVDNEYYFGQHEVYTDKSVGEKGHHGFSMSSMMKEEPTYVLLNGEKYAITPNRYGPVTAQKGDSSRVFMVTGGPNLSSSFHPIGNVWSEAYPNGAVASQPDEYAQTMTVAPGSCFVGTLDHPVPEHIKLVDHALTRVARRGMLGIIEVEGGEEPEIFDPSPGKGAGKDEEGPSY